MKQFNDAVVYVLNGKPIPAIVLKSTLSGSDELLTLLYADPGAAAQINAGTVRGIGQTAFAVPPAAPGKLFAWQEVTVPESAPAPEPSLPDGALDAQAVGELRKAVEQAGANAIQWEQDNGILIAKLSQVQAQFATAESTITAEKLAVSTLTSEVEALKAQLAQIEATATAPASQPAPEATQPQ